MVMKEKIRDFKAALERVSSGISETEVVQLPSGDTVRLIHDAMSPGGYRIDSTGEGMAGPVFQQQSAATKARIEEIQELTRRILSGESDAEELTLPSGGTVRLTRNQSAHGDITVEGFGSETTFRTVAFGESEVRPLDYPEDLPFLPACPSSLMDGGVDGSRTMSWSRVSDPAGLLSTIREELSSHGWTCRRDTTGTMGVTRTAAMLFRKGETERMFLLTGSAGQFHIMMREHRKGPDAASDKSEPQAAG